jgi:hypothetical protein
VDYWGIQQTLHGVRSEQVNTIHMSTSFFRPPDPISFDDSRSIKWNKFKAAFQYFIKATGVIKEDKDVQVATLLNLIGAEGQDIYSTFKWGTGEDKDDLIDVYKKFDNYCTPLTNVVYERYCFFNRKQNDGESINEYMTSLRLLMKSCEFATVTDIEDSLLRDKLVTGCSNPGLRERLLRETNVTLAKALSIAHATEASKRQVEEISPSQVDMMRRDSPRYSKPPNCSRCGNQHSPRQCPAFGKRCIKCNISGHFAKCCKTKTVHEIDDNRQREDGKSNISWLKIDVVTKVNMPHDK